MFRNISSVRMGDPKTICCLYAQAVIAINTAELSRHTAAFLRHPSAEPLHRARVSLRRLHNLLTIFHDVLGGPDPKARRRPIAAAGKALGRSRDLDVWIHIVKKQLSHLPSRHQAAGKKLLILLEGERRQEQLLARGVLSHLQKSRTIKEAQEHARVNCPHPLSHKALWAMGRQKVAKRLKQFLVFRSCANNPQDGQGLHRLRIQAKKLRYTLESLEPVFGSRTKYFYETIYAMQTALGELHDAEMLILFLNTIKKKKSHRDMCAMLEEGIVVFAKIRQQSYDKFFALWRKNNKQQFWMKLRNFIKRSP